MAVQELSQKQALAPVELRKARSPWGDALRQLLKNRLATLGAVFILLLVVTAILAPVLAPKPYDLTNLRSNYARPGAEYPLGADYWGGICSAE